jgi:hypothetical protein
MFTVATAKTQKRQTLFNDISLPPKMAINACGGWLNSPNFSPVCLAVLWKPESCVTPDTLPSQHSKV